MLTIGRVCIKIAGRDAGNQCVIVDILDNNFVLIDGLTRRRKCNIIHLEPTSKTLDIAQNASTEDVISAFKGMGIEITKGTKKESKPKPTKKRTQQKQKK